MADEARWNDPESFKLLIRIIGNAAYIENPSLFWTKERRAVVQKHVPQIEVYKI